MRIASDRAIFTVSRRDGVWAVEHDGERFGHSPDKEVAKAAANREVLRMLERGRPCQVRVSGETGYFP